MIKIFTEDNLSANPRIRYTFNHIFCILGYRFEFIDDIKTIKGNDLLIFYGEQRPLLPSSTLMNINITYNESYLDKIKELKFLKTEQFYTKHVKNQIKKELHACHINYDIIQIIFHLLSREEEYEYYKNSEDYTQFEYRNSLMFNLNLTDYPVVDALIKIFDKTIHALIINANIKLDKLPLWPEGKKFAVCLTHDVDHIKAKSLIRVSWWFMQLIKNLIVLDLDKANRYVTKMKCLWHTEKDPHWNFEKWMEIEQQFNFRSTFYFMSLEKTLSREGRRYTLNSPRLQHVLQHLEKENWEVALHGSYGGFLSLKDMVKEKQRIEKIIRKEVAGIRHHYLRFKVPTSWQIHEKAGLKYDATLGWAKAFGFRAGTSYPFYPYDLEQDKKRNLLEIPLVMMDTVIGDTNRPEWSVEEVVRKGEYFFDIGEEFGGMITLSWHQESLDEGDYPHWGEIYRILIKKLSERPDVFVGSARDIWQWWHQRNEKLCKFN